MRSATEEDLREIAEETIKVPDLTEAAVYKLRKHVEQIAVSYTHLTLPTKASV